MAKVHLNPAHVFDAVTISAGITTGISGGKWLTLRADEMEIATLFYNAENSAYLDHLAQAINAVPKRMSQKLLSALAADPSNAEADRDSHDEARAWHSRPVPVSFDGGPF